MISDTMRRHLLMLSQWWGYDEDRGTEKLMTCAPVRFNPTQQVHVILDDPGTGLPTVRLFPSAQAAREAWHNSNHKDGTT